MGFPTNPLTALLSTKNQLGFRLFRGEDLNRQANNINALSQFGSSGNAGLMSGESNIIVQQVSAGLNPASTGADIVLAAFSIPANGFDIANRGIFIMAAGALASNTNTKTLKVIVGCTTAVVGSAVTGGTTIASGVFNTTTAAGGWQLGANVFKTGANGSNTQQAIHEAAQSGSVIAALVAPQPLTLTEGSSILCAITGNAATTATDITFNFLQVNAMN